MGFDLNCVVGFGFGLLALACVWGAGKLRENGNSQALVSLVMLLGLALVIGALIFVWRFAGWL